MFIIVYSRSVLDWLLFVVVHVYSVVVVIHVEWLWGEFTLCVGVIMVSDLAKVASLQFVYCAIVLVLL